VTGPRSAPSLALSSMMRAHWPWLLGSGLLVLSSLWTSFVWSQNRAVLAVLEQDRAEGAEVGAFIGHVTGTSVDGRRASYVLDARESGSLLFALSFDCEFCARNRSAWERLSGIAAERGVQVIWLSRDSFDRVQSVEVSPEPLVAEPSHRTYQAAALSLVPQTMVLDKNGVVTATFTGVIDSSKESWFVEQIMAVADGRSSLAVSSQSGQERR
jgi:hypothetical protein